MTAEFGASPAAPAGGTTTHPPFIQQLGPRALQRAVPRLGPVLAGAGAQLAFVGLLVLSFDTSDVLEGDGDSNKMVGFLLTAAGVAAGYALIVAFRDGGLATFGSGLAAMLVPFMLFFLTWDEGDSPPFSIDVVLLLSVVLWLVAYVVRPSRGRPVFLGAAALGLWLFVLEQIESAFTMPFEMLPFALAPAEVLAGPETSAPDAGTIGLVCLVFAAAYLVGAFVADKNGWRGMAPPLLVVGFFALYTGFGSVQEDLDPFGSGLLLAAAGVAIVFVATRMGRRGTSWFGSLAVVIGVAWMIGDLFEDSDDVTAPAIALMIVGALVAFAADRWAAAINEPPEVRESVAVASGPPDAASAPYTPPSQPPPPDPIDLE